jgi:hypothetical protein
MDDEETRQKYIQRDINLIFRGSYPACLACRDLKHGQTRPSRKKRAEGGYLQPSPKNAQRKPKKKMTSYGCKLREVADLYHPELRILLSLVKHQSGQYLL